MGFFVVYARYKLTTTQQIFLETKHGASPSFACLSNENENR